MHPLYEIVLKDLRTDIAQMAEEGHDVPALERELEAACATGSFDALVRLQETLWYRPSPPGFAYVEPNDWASIAAARYVPPRSRFAEMLRFMQAACAANDDWETINNAMIAKYHAEASRFNHAIPNAAIVILGLLKGRGDFTRTLGITVMAGLDTDCTGATAGSILGCALGTAGIPASWTAPFHDTIRSQLRDMPEVRISDAARRMADVARPNARRA